MVRRRGAQPLEERQPSPRGRADKKGAPISGRLGDLLVHHNVVTPGQLAEALLQQSASGRKLGEVLVANGALSEGGLAEALAEQLGIPIADLRRQAPNPEAIAHLPEAVARAVRAIPMRIDGDTLDIAMSDPTDQDGRQQLENAAGMKVRIHVAPMSDVQRAINNTYRALASVERHIEAFKETAREREPETQTPLQQAITQDAPVVQVVNLLITQALRDRASDIHIEPQDGNVRVRYRIDGALHDVLSLPETMSQAVVSRIKIMAGMNIVERQRAQDGQISMDSDGRGIDIRVATVPTLFGEKTVMRLLDKSRSLLRLEDLGMPKGTYEQYEKIIRSPFGMILCAGPTGSGKTTTLYASLNEINEPERNIMTIEDPVEYVFPGINQIPIKEQTGGSFAAGLRAILRQDPDVILVGEIRDVETARIATQSALTGHFVLSSLHATDSVTALHRFMDMGIEPFLIASSVLGIVGQRLVRRVCKSCKIRYAPSSEEMVFYVESGGKEKKKFYRGEGCNFCANTGYQDRIGVYEFMRVTEAMKQMIVKDASHEELRELAIEQGMRPLRTQALQLVADDVTTISEVLRAIYVL